MAEAVQKEAALGETNRGLSAAVERGQQKCAALEAKVYRIRKYRDWFHAAGHVECKGCGNMYASNVFGAHIKLCRELLKAENQMQMILSERGYKTTSNCTPIQVNTINFIICIDI